MDIVRASQNPIIINESMKDLLAKVKKPEKEEDKKKILKPVKKQETKKEPSKKEIDSSFDIDNMMKMSQDLFNKSSKLAYS